MKRLVSCMFVALVIAIGAYGIYHHMLWENRSPHAQQQWLMEFFKKKGFSVAWELNDVIDMSNLGLRRLEDPSDELYQRNFNALRGSNFIKFFEHKTHNVFFVFGERVYAIENKQGEGTMNSITSLTIPSGDQIWFKTKGGGEFLLASHAELELLFPYPEVRLLRTRPLILLWTLWVLSGTLAASGTVEWIHDIPQRNRQTRIHAQKTSLLVAQPAKRTRSPMKVHDQSTTPMPVITKETLLARLKAHISQTENPAQREQLEALYHEASNQRRVSLIAYAVNVRAEAILSTGSHESQERMGLAPKNSMSGTLEDVQEQHHVEQLSDIDAYVPSPLAACVTGILVALLRLSGKKPLIGEHRILRVNLQRNVSRKGFSPETFKEAFDWLVRQGVILQVNKHGADGSCSINPHADKAKTPEGKIIMSVAFRVRQQMVKRH